MLDWDALLPPKSNRTADKVGAGGTANSGTNCSTIPASDAGIAARQIEGDDRRRCIECGNLGTRGICQAAQRGEIVASRSYTPMRDILRRCEGFNPLPTDPDQTHGRDKWGWLAEYSRPKDATL